MEITGLDLHKRASQLSIKADDGTITDRRIATSRERFTAVLGDRSPAHILLEASTESEWVARHLESLGHEVIVVDPNYGLMYANRRTRLFADVDGGVGAALRGIRAAQCADRRGRCAHRGVREGGSHRDAADHGTWGRAGDGERVRGHHRRHHAVSHGARTGSVPRRDSQPAEFGGEAPTRTDHESRQLAHALAVGRGVVANPAIEIRRDRRAACVDRADRAATRQARETP